MTVTSLIEKSLRKLGILHEGESLSTAQASDGLEVLNDLLYSLSVQRWGIHKTAIVSHTLTAGTGSYTIGSGATIDEDRPIKVLGAYIRRDGKDYHLKVRSSQYFDDVFDKDRQNMPLSIYYDPTYPNGTVHLDPVPNQAGTLYMRVWQPMAVYAAGSDIISLPPEYMSYLTWNHPRDFASEFDIPVPENVAVRSIETLKVLKNLHSEPIPQMNTNPMIIGKSRYNINTDGYNG